MQALAHVVAGFGGITFLPHHIPALLQTTLCLHGE